MSVQRVLHLLTASTSASGLRPTSSHQCRQIGRATTEPENRGTAREALGMSRNLYRPIARVTSVNSVQDAALPYIRECCTAPQLERLEAVWSIEEPITAAKVVARHGWSELEANDALQDLSARGYLRSVPRVGHFRTEAGLASVQRRSA